MKLVVLRLGHRKARDKRITTHVFLAGRALGADAGVLCGENDEAVLKSVSGVAGNWGGRFPVKHSPSYRKTLSGLKRRGFRVAHLTMYGERVEAVAPAIRRKARGRLCVVVGAEKVPGDVYRLSDWNVAVTGQPHSEVAALAIFLHELFGGKELAKKFAGARLSIVPQARGKKVLAAKPRGNQKRIYSRNAQL
ncbi:MAG: tRNA (cytidine(56)-2'-O)-methyltransferase [Candidatus ainarchaeum sp.]|nr:tRNA (cytidine(56)-2'-O)-methyltransferase [Candidatus ainarchaeum sp.]